MTQPAYQLPQIPVRLSRSQIITIRYGLGRVRAACRFMNRHENPLQRHTPAEAAQRNLTAHMIRLWRTVRSKVSANTSQTKFRLRLNVEQLALCSFAIRIFRQGQIIAGPDSLSPQECSSIRMLLDKLENLRKQAKRATAKTVGTQAYVAGAEHLRLFEIAARYEIFPKVPAYLDFSDHLLRFRIHTVNTLVRQVSQRYQ